MKGVELLDAANKKVVTLLKQLKNKYPSELNVKRLLAGYNAMWPGSNYLLSAGSGATGMYRGIKLYEAGVNATNGDLAREAVSAAIDGVTNVQGMGGKFSMVPGTGHAAMNMYIAQANGGVWDIIQSGNQVPPNECA